MHYITYWVFACDAQSLAQKGNHRFISGSTLPWSHSRSRPQDAGAGIRFSAEHACSTHVLSPAVTDADFHGTSCRCCICSGRHFLAIGGKDREQIVQKLDVAANEWIHIRNQGAADACVQSVRGSFACHLCRFGRA